MKRAVYLFVMLLAVAGWAKADPVIAVNFDGDAFLIDSSTGTGSLLGPTGFFFLNSMAKNSAGVIYTQGGTDIFTPELITIDPKTGVGTVVATLSVGIRGLAFSSSDVLYGIVSGIQTSDPDSLYRINTTTGAATLIGVTGFSGLQSLEFSPSGTLYSWDIARGLVTIDPLTGVTTLVNPSAGGGDIQTLAFSPGGQLFGARDALYTIDTTTGIATAVGAGGYSDIRGMEFLTVPEPSSILLLGIGVLGLAGPAKRKLLN